MKSMTGYGRAEIQLPNHTGVIEISSVNKKGFEFLLHGPKEWQFFEKKGQEIIRTRADRGRIRLSILIHPPSALTLESSGDQFHKVNDHLEVLKKLCELGEVPYAPTIDLIQRIVSSSPREVILPPLENIEEILVHSTELALSEMITMRKKEGLSLSKDLVIRCKTLRDFVYQIEQQSKGIASAWRDKLLQRLSESGLEIDCENEAVRREFTVFSEKSDISEEITRIHSHLEQFESGLNHTKPIGRKLEFIVQEMGREFNTLGSKSVQSNVSSLVIDAKVEIEKIREQVMNIE